VWEIGKEREGEGGWGSREGGGERKDIKLGTAGSESIGRWKG